MKHTPEPWNLHESYDGSPTVVPDEDSHNGQGFTSASRWLAKGERLIGEIAYFTPTKDFGFPRVETDEEMTANAERIVACVNACAGMSDPAKEIESGKTAIIGERIALEVVSKLQTEASEVKKALANLNPAAIQGAVEALTWIESDSMDYEGARRARIALKALAALEVEG